MNTPEYKNYEKLVALFTLIYGNNAQSLTVSPGTRISVGELIYTSEDTLNDAFIKYKSEEERPAGLTQRYQGFKKSELIAAIYDLRQAAQSILNSLESDKQAAAHRLEIIKAELRKKEAKDVRKLTPEELAEEAKKLSKYID